jgi:hypothetical protein
MALCNHSLSMALRLLGRFSLCAAILLPTLCPGYCAAVGSAGPTVEVIRPLSLLDLFYTESSREESPEREVEAATELILGVHASRPAREPKCVPPLSLRGQQVLTENLRHLHVSLPLAAHALRHGNGLAAHCRC